MTVREIWNKVDWVGQRLTVLAFLGVVIALVVWAMVEGLSAVAALDPVDPVDPVAPVDLAVATATPHRMPEAFERVPVGTPVVFEIIDGQIVVYPLP